jgi:hypothetical protein
MIYTSNFTHVLTALPAGMRAVSIAPYHPAGWPADDDCPSLRPWPFMVSDVEAGHFTELGFEQKYRQYVLSGVSADWILTHYDNCVLCCHHAPGEFCHRQIVRRWIREETGIEIAELDFSGELPATDLRFLKPNPNQGDGCEQLSLFG